MTDKYQMLYCDNISNCWVNTFEYGDTGICPGCGQAGLEVRQ